MISLAVPNGSLAEKTFSLLEKAGIIAAGCARERAYELASVNPLVGKIKVLRPQEIPRYVQQGYFDLGIAGKDWIAETNADIIEVAELNYSKRTSGSVKVVLAVAKNADVETPRQLKPGSRIATDYPNLARKYFAKLGIPVEIEFSFGCTEAKVPELADAIVDITETGETLEKNGLRILDVLLISSTKLFANKASLAAKGREIREITFKIKGAMA